MTDKIKISVTMLVLLCAPLSIAEFDHSLWQGLLQQHVNEFEGSRVTQLDYEAMQNDQLVLQSYLRALAAVSRVTFDSWTDDDQLAFLINAYNAGVVALILTEYPDIDSINDIGFLFSSPWRRNVISLFGEQVSLDDIEHGMIRGWDKYFEPRIHFAVNCAAIGCPALQSDAYVGDNLDNQLEHSTRLFLADRQRNYFSNGRFYVSRIFDWYEEDFDRGWFGVNSVSEFLTRYADALGLDTATISALKREDVRIRYLQYDWGLNDTR
ncbi:MAG TPA: DUF547 domain-containing protein [Gammaproteobacteria bacterium]|nr:DUF547 domain-containing protein [Gammaproteobacteria bacterium]HIL63939.1 DUF547 domain-containing protein [Porticoccaceae bacterium]